MLFNLFFIVNTALYDICGKQENERVRERHMIHEVASALDTWHCNGECYLDCANRTMIKMKQSKQAKQSNVNQVEPDRAQNASDDDCDGDCGDGKSIRIPWCLCVCIYSK